MVTFKQITLDEWQRGDYRALAMIHRTADELFRSHKIVFEEYEEDGLGRAKNAFFLGSNARQFLVVEYLETRIPTTNIFILKNPDTMSSDLKAILQALELTFSDLDWVNENINI